MNGPRESGVPARRAVLRWTWRLFRREWRQQLLVLILVTIGVAAAVAGSAMAISADADPNADFGTANALIDLDGSDPAAVRATIKDARDQVGPVDVIWHTAAEVPGVSQPIEVRAQDPQGRFGQPMLALLDGRYPKAPDEVALTDRAASLLSARIGERVELGGVARTAVGTVENPTELDDEFALVAPDADTAADSVTLLIDDGFGVNPARFPAEVLHMSSDGGSDVSGAVTATIVAAITLVMALVALVAAAGFVVVAQRRQRQLGLLSAIGATVRQLRLVMIVNGAIVGMVAAIVGAMLGVIGWIASAPWLESGVNHRIDRFALPWTLMATTLLIAVVMATAAAWWPARVVSRLSVMAALSGRPSRPRPVHRSLVAAFALVVCGVGAIAAARPTSNHVRPVVLIVGLLAVVLGVVFVTPAAVRALAVPARLLPFAPRLALRNLARYQARAAAALAAITLGLGISVAVVAIAGANEYRSDEGNLSEQQLLIRLDDPADTSSPDPTASEQRRLDARAATVAAAIGRDAEVAPLDFAINPVTSTDAPAEPIMVGAPKDANTTEVIGEAYVATPELLARYGIDPATIDPATDLLTVHTGAIELVDFSTRPDSNAPATEVQHVDLPRYGDAPNSLITEAAMTRQGWVPMRAAWLVESPDALTSAQVSAARAAAADAGLTIDVRADQDGLAELRTGATTAGVVLAIAIVMMAIGLLRGESARDLQTLTATGAARRTRRALTATTAATLALLGVVLGTAGAYIALLASFHATLGKLAPVPVAHLLILAVGLPLAASAAGWLMGGREPRGFARQAIE
jgi:putative ABC transport system permease protein